VAETGSCLTDVENAFHIEFQQNYLSTMPVEVTAGNFDKSQTAAMVSTDNPAIDPPFYLIALEGPLKSRCLFQYARNIAFYEWS